MKSFFLFETEEKRFPKRMALCVRPPKLFILLSNFVKSNISIFCNIIVVISCSFKVQINLRRAYLHTGMQNLPKCMQHGKQSLPKYLYLCAISTRFQNWCTLAVFGVLTNTILAKNVILVPKFTIERTFYQANK